jgi:NADH-quinone oxidoreductase subunit N
MEMQSFIFYILCSMHNTKNTIENLSMEACLKYFIYGSFASAFFLFGVALIYASIGTLDIYQIMYNLQDSYLNNSGILFLGAFLILIGILFKLAIFPFHV